MQSYSAFLKKVGFALVATIPFFLILIPLLDDVSFFGESFLLVALGLALALGFVISCFNRRLRLICLLLVWPLALVVAAHRFFERMS